MRKAMNEKGQKCPVNRVSTSAIEANRFFASRIATKMVSRGHECTRNATQCDKLVVSVSRVEAISERRRKNLVKEEQSIQYMSHQAT